MTGVSVTRRGVTPVDGRVGVALVGICVTGTVNLCILPFSFLTALPGFSVAGLSATGVTVILFGVLTVEKINLSLPSSKSTQPLKEKCISEVVRIVSIIIFHLSKL